MAATSQYYYHEPTVGIQLIGCAVVELKVYHICSMFTGNLMIQYPKAPIVS